MAQLELAEEATAVLKDFPKALLLAGLVSVMECVRQAVLLLGCEARIGMV